MRIALAWVDLKDPTDRVIARGLSPELGRLGHEVVLVGPRSGLTTAARLRRFSRERAIDLWHCHVFGRSHRLFEKAGLRLLVSLHLILKDYLPFLGGLPGLKRLLKNAVWVTVPSESARREFLGLCPEWRGRTSVVPYGITLPKPAARPASSVMDRDVPIQYPSDSGRPALKKPFVLSVARLAPYKGPDLLLMALARAPGLRLVMCGRDQLGGAIQAFARRLGVAHRVWFTGELASAGVARLVKDCEFLVMSSRRENLPLAVLEALAAGKPVVAAQAGGIPELIRDGVEGFLVPAEDVAALSRRMAELAGDKALRGTMGKAALARSRRFTWEKAALRYDRLYAACSKRRRLPASAGAAGRAAPRAP